MAEPLPDWLYPPGGLTALDLDRLPGLPGRTELIDGGLFFMSPQKRFHMRVSFMVWAGLHAVVPADLEVQHDMSIVLGPRDRPIPDLCVVQRSAIGGDDDTWYPAAAVVLVAEIVSPESQARDRERKPQLYAQAGIPHFWRVENAGGAPVVHVFQLDDAAHSYRLSGIHHDRLTLAEPFPIDLSLDLRGP